ncbi:uncharacterized protein LOC125297728 [Xyrichtys novacula]|uniref:Uncharacterized protein LOC125297728 n=1 Tax=Xyrichtys novacula TaxID=13765 RepID=A0AAV1GTD0_XYRNO|nr:uncharacterized protein LOC125297728 [Xyrichtys novacula]
MVTPAFVKKKWENLKQKYKDLKCPKTGVSTVRGETTAASWKWYTLMDEAIGGRPSITLPVLIALLSQDAAVVSTPSVVSPGGDSSTTSTPKRWLVDVVEALRELREKEAQLELEAREREARHEEIEERRRKEDIEIEQRRRQEDLEREERGRREDTEREERRKREAVGREERIWREMRERDERRERDMAVREDCHPVPVFCSTDEARRCWLWKVPRCFFHSVCLWLQQVPIAEANVVEDYAAGDDLRHKSHIPPPVP